MCQQLFELLFILLSGQDLSAELMLPNICCSHKKREEYYKVWLKTAKFTRIIAIYANITQFFNTGISRIIYPIA